MRVIILLQIAAATVALAGQIQSSSSNSARNSAAIARREIFGGGRGPGRGSGRGFGRGGGRGGDDDDDEPTYTAEEIVEIYGSRLEALIRDINDSNTPDLGYEDPEVQLLTTAVAAAYLLGGVTDVDEMTALLREKNTLWDDARLRSFVQSFIVDRRLGGGGNA